MEHGFCIAEKPPGDDDVGLQTTLQRSKALRFGERTKIKYGKAHLRGLAVGMEIFL